MPDQMMDDKERGTVGNLIPDPGDDKVGKKVFDILVEVVTDKVQIGLHDKWLEHYKLTRNKHWKKSQGNVPLVSVNLIHTHRQRTVNTLTDNDPAFNIISMASGEDQDYSEETLKVQRQCEYWWTEQEQQIRYEESVRNGESYGIAIEKVIFDPALEAPLGEARTVVVDPYHFGIYPVTCKEVQDAEAVLYFYPMSLREAKRRWPKKASEIVPDGELLDELGSERRELTSGSSGDGFLARVGSLVKTLFTSTHGSDAKKDEVLVCECWVKHYGAGYPGDIRCVTVCSSGKVVLDDRPNPSINPTLSEDVTSLTFLWDKFPFSAAPSVRDTSNFWGMSDIEQLEQLQKEFNKAVSQAVFLKDKSARPKVINPQNSGVSNDQFTNAPGIINPTDEMKAAAIRYLEFPNMPYDIQAMITLLKDLFFLVSGTFELENAQTPGREVIAHRAIAALIEHAALMMRGKIRNYSKLLRDRGRMYLSHMQNWYTEPRVFAYQQGTQTMVGTIRSDEIQLPLKFTVINGSTLPTSKQFQREEALELFKLGAVDQQALLEDLDYSNRDEVVKRMKEGPYAELLSRMSVMGIPDPVVQVLQQVATLEQKDFEKAMKGGQIPMLSLPEPAQQGDPMQDANVQLAQAKVAKEEADRMLTIEKAKTEQVQQQVLMAGIEFDQQKLRIERTQTLADVDAKIRGINIKAQDKKPFVKASEQSDVEERGLQSNNQTEEM